MAKGGLSAFSLMRSAYKSGHNATLSYGGRVPSACLGTYGSPQDTTNRARAAGRRRALKTIAGRVK